MQFREKRFRCEASDEMDSAVRELQKSVELLKNGLNERQAKRFKHDQLTASVKHICEYLAQCEQCAEHADQASDLLQLFTKDPELVSKEELREYHDVLKGMLEHLKKAHKLVDEGYYVSTYMSLGISLGLVFGVLVKNIGIGIAAGLCIGLMIGSLLDTDARKKNRVI